MCPFDKKPTITFGGLINFELAQNVDSILYPKVLKTYQSTKLRENPILMTISVFVSNWCTVLLFKWYNF